MGGLFAQEQKLAVSEHYALLTGQNLVVKISPGSFLCQKNVEFLLNAYSNLIWHVGMIADNKRRETSCTLE